jgi:hypothetical protein
VLPDSAFPTIFTTSWDDVGFDDMTRTLRRHAPPGLAEAAVDVVRRSAQSWNGRLPPTSERLALGAEERRALRSALLRARNATVGRLREAVATLDGVTVLAAVAALGGLHGLHARRQFTIPGAFDREVDVLFEALRDDGPARRREPAWSDVAVLLELAREVLLIETVIPSSTPSATERVRIRSQVAPYLGATYGPISSDLTVRAVDALVRAGHEIGPELAAFDRDAQSTITAWASRLFTVLGAAVPAAHGVDSVVEAVVRTRTPAELVERIALDRDDTGVIPAPVLRRPARRGEGPALLARGDGSVLVIPRLLVTDRHETFDRFAESLLVPDPSTRGNYSDIRAATLDQVIAESLRRLLPGSEVLVNATATMDGVEYEQDVLAFWNGICICVETKAPRINPHQAGGRTSVPWALRNDIAKGAAQATRIADALERGAVVIGGAARSATRSYPLVATFSSWWGVDTDVAALVELGAFAAPDAAMLTSAEKFAVFERVFETGEDFVAYLDHRLSHQRRPFVVVADEYELIGGYYTNPSNAPLLPRPGGTVLKDAFQDDVTDTVHASFAGKAKRSRWLTHDAAPFIEEQVRRLREDRPPGWLTAYSALRRMSAESQRFAVSVIARRRRVDRSVDIDDAERLAVVTVARDDALDPQSWSNLERQTAGCIALIAVRRPDQAVLAVRGVDDETAWFAPGVAERVRRPTGTGSPTARGGQREQPRRRGRRH